VPFPENQSGDGYISHRGGELFWGRETARCGVQSCLGTDFCELIYAVDED
jgi:hypothetical protein